MVLIAGNVASDAAADFARCVGEAVPDGFAFAVLVPGAFDLVGGRGYAPDEAFGKSGFFDLRFGYGAGDLICGWRSGVDVFSAEGGACDGGY